MFFVAFFEFEYGVSMRLFVRQDWLSEAIHQAVVWIIKAK
jgi:hypothetical protein